VSLDLCLLNTALGSKFLNDPDATHAFQKVAVAYEVLSKPHLKRLYDNRSPQSHFDVFATRPTGHAEETFRGVILGAFNDFLDGDLEVIRTFLSEFIFFGSATDRPSNNSLGRRYRKPRISSCLFFSEAINDINPSIKLGEDGINSVLVTLQGLRERALSTSLVYHSVVFLLPNGGQLQIQLVVHVYMLSTAKSYAW